jgi:hypothetical protein
VDEDEVDNDAPPADPVADAGSAALEPAHHFSLLQPDERYPSGEHTASAPTPEPARSETPPAAAPSNNIAAPHTEDAGTEPPER